MKHLLEKLLLLGLAIDMLKRSHYWGTIKLVFCCAVIGAIAMYFKG